MIKKYSIIICFLFLLLICGCSKNKTIESEKDSQKDSIKEEIKVEEETENIEDKEEIEEVIKEEQIDTSSNDTNKKEEQKENETSKEDDTVKEEADTKEEVVTPSIIGTWLYNNGDYVYIFEDSKIIIIKTKMNNIKEHTYKVDGDKIVIDENTVQTFEVKGDKLYLGYTVLTKAPSDYKYPSIYGNLDIFYGTWKLETPDKVITLEDGYEKTLEETMILNKNNMSGFGSCGGSGCHGYIFNFLNSKPELYRGSLCYELVDNNTLSQIKCHEDNIIGYPGWEDETLHNIIYKRAS